MHICARATEFLVAPLLTGPVCLLRQSLGFWRRLDVNFPNGVESLGSLHFTISNQGRIREFAKGGLVPPVPFLFSSSVPFLPSPLSPLRSIDH